MGFVVDLHDRGGAHHLHALRRMLETETAALAAKSIGPDDLTAADQLLGRIEAELARDEPDHDAIIDDDIAFLQIVARASGNPVLAALIEALGGRTIRDRLWRSIRQHGADEATHAEHRSILAALADHDPTVREPGWSLTSSPSRTTSSNDHPLEPIPDL
ncbi:FCD domain-containing protein [Kribbella sp. NBC_01510]|uniref:FadR/GntR family transcriptional regulator n=1 Tax=Kribbella sp. NBC_01510 TaxID=2903581 RepID=UPI003862DCC1